MSYIQTTILFVCLLNAYVTFRIWRKHEFDRFQKIGQSVIVWLLPILGAVGILVYIRTDENPRGPNNPNDGQGNDSMPGGVQ